MATVFVVDDMALEGTFYRPMKTEKAGIQLRAFRGVWFRLGAYEESQKSYSTHSTPFTGQMDSWLVKIAGLRPEDYFTVTPQVTGGRWNYHYWVRQGSLKKLDKAGVSVALFGTKEWYLAFTTLHGGVLDKLIREADAMVTKNLEHARARASLPSGDGLTGRNNFGGLNGRIQPVGGRFVPGAIARAVRKPKQAEPETMEMDCFLPPPAGLPLLITHKPWKGLVSVGAMPHLVSGDRPDAYSNAVEAIRAQVAGMASCSPAMMSAPELPKASVTATVCTATTSVGGPITLKPFSLDG